MVAVTSLATIGGRGSAKEQSLPARAPAAPVHVVETSIFGHVVRDPYRWMESSSPEFEAWVKAQAARTRAVLSGQPSHDAFVARVNELVSPHADVVSVRVFPGRVYYLKRLSGEDRFKLFVREGWGAPEQLLLDPGAGGHHSIDYYVPSPDGRYVIYGTSTNGSEQSVLRVLDVGEGHTLADSIDRARAADPYWLPDSRTFFYRRENKRTSPSESYLNTRVYHHVLGRNPDLDTPVFGQGLSERVSFEGPDVPLVMVFSGSREMFGIIAHGPRAEYTIYHAPLDQVGPHIAWKKLFDVDDYVTDMTVHGDDVYVLVGKDAAHSRVARTKLNAADLAHAETMVPPGRYVIRDIFTASDAVYVRLMEGGNGRLLRVPFDKARSESIPLPYDGTVNAPITNASVPGAVVELESWVRAPAFYRYDPVKRTVIDTGVSPSGDDTSAYESIEVQAKSADGVAVPLSIVYRKGIALDGKRPTWLTAYGSYGESFDPTFSARRLAWLERGGIYAVAHVRGGGEFGEDWHLAGMKKNKKNGVDDFIACAQYLIDHKYTSPQHLGVESTSAGSIVVGGAVIKRPELFAAALIRVGVSDLIRSEEGPGGPANAIEFGSSRRPDELPYLLAASPYYQVKDGTRYPAMMFTASAQDARVPLWQSAKMVARLQAATASDEPVLLRVAYEAGHGAGLGTATSEINAELADCYTFFYWQLLAKTTEH